LKSVCNKTIVFTFFIFLILIFINFSSISAYHPKIDHHDQTRHGDFFLVPSFYDFGQMLEGQSDSTYYAIYARIGCAVPPCYYTFQWNCEWVDVTPTSGVSMGEIDYILVTIDTTDLSLGNHSCYIDISTNLGNEKFWVYVEVVENTPILKITSQVGRFSKLFAEVRNVGDQPAINISWAISIEGGLFKKIHTNSSGILNEILPDHRNWISSPFLLGLGYIDAVLTVEAENVDPVLNTIRAILLGCILIVFR